MQKSLWYQSILVFSMGIFALALPWSNFLMSLGVILPGVLTLYYFIKNGIKVVLPKGYASLLVILYLLAVTGLIYSNNIDYGLNDLRKKLPLFVVPIVVIANKDLLSKHKQTIINLFVFGSVACTLIYSIRWHLLGYKTDDYRSFVPLLSHIRFSVCLCISLLIIINNYLKQKKWLWVNIFFTILILNALWQLRSISAITLLSIAIPAYFYNKGYIKGRSILALVLGIVFLAGLVVGQHYFSKDDIPKNLAEKTELGNKYVHDSKLLVSENGHYIYLYLAYDEMNAAWKKRTGIDAKNELKNGYNYEAILTRYLTSKNLHKDAAGIAALSEQDVENIKKGYTNYKNDQFSALRKRSNALFFEMDAYLSTKDMEGHSATMRIEYADVAWSVFKNNFWIGTGTGDIADEIGEEHQKRSVLSKQYQKRTHNQLLSFLATYGIIGFIVIAYIILICFVGATKISALSKSILLLLFVSFLWEDVLETQAGICTFVFFYALLFDVEDEDESASSYKASIPSTILVWLKSWARK